MFGEMEQQITALAARVKVTDLAQIVHGITRLTLQHPLPEASNSVPVGDQSFFADDFPRDRVT